MPKGKKCPNCRLNCYKNNLGDWTCLKCGVIEGNHKLENFSDKKIEDYLG